MDEPIKGRLQSVETENHTTTPLERLRSMSKVGHKVQPANKRAADAMLAVYKGRLTYTFIASHEVASVHFDQIRGDIFYKGHTIRHLDMGEDIRGYLWELAEILAHDPEGAEYSADYSATLRKCLADK